MFWTTWKHGETIAALIEEVEAQIAPIHRSIERLVDGNQHRVLDSFRRHQVSDGHFIPTTGYGYDDVGRDTLDRIYADVFGAEAGLVRPQIISGTHAIAIALFGVLRPGDELLYITGAPMTRLRRSSASAAAASVR